TQRFLVGDRAPNSGNTTDGNRTLAFFFFQAEDGIRDGHVTGVQTCALPISESAVRRKPEEPSDYVRGRAQAVWQTDWTQVGADRSEERRVGKECRSRWAAAP